MLYKPFYDPLKSYEENYEQGPFGPFADGLIYQSTGEPPEFFLGQKVFLPFGIAPGPLLNSKYVISALDKGFDIVSYKTVRTKFKAVNGNPNVVAIDVKNNLTLEQAMAGVTSKEDYSEPLSITNSFGVPSTNPDVWQADFTLCNKHAKAGQVVVGCFQGTPDGKGREEQLIDDYALAAKLLVEAGAKVLEANLSCPNESKSNLLCFDTEKVKKIAEKIKNTIGNAPLILKIAYFKDNNQFGDFLRELGGTVDAFAMINTIAAKVMDRTGNQALPGEGRLISGVCGESIKWAGLEMVERAKLWREKLNLDFKIIGIGGVSNVNDYKIYRATGADAVECATGAMWNPYLAQEIKEKLNN